MTAAPSPTRMESMIIASSATWEGFSSVGSDREEKTKVRRRGRSATVRNPEDSTNAACNIHGGKAKANMPEGKNYFEMPEPQNDPLSVVATIAFADHFALFGNSTLALVASFLFFVVAVVISFLLEDMIDDGE